MQKFDYISVLAGGKCKFNCDFCIGNKIRKDVQPHFSTKWKAFIECFSDMTELLSVSGDTSDPSFIKNTWEIPKLAKRFNKNIKVTLHTRNQNVMEKAFDNGYDKFVLSIDEEFDWENNFEKFLKIKDKIRFSFVMTNYNFWAIEKWFENNPKIYKEFEITIRPEVNIVKYTNWEHTFKRCFEAVGQKCVNEKNYIELENGALQNKTYPKLWFWNYNKTNPKLNVRYLFSDGLISSNCQWNKVIKE